jgi:hypothetical protein
MKFSQTNVLKLFHFNFNVLKHAQGKSAQQVAQKLGFREVIIRPAPAFWVLSLFLRADSGRLSCITPKRFVLHPFQSIIHQHCIIRRHDFCVIYSTF